MGAGSSLPANLVVPTCMARGLGSSGGATLQRSKLDLKQETKTLEPRVDNSGGGGNNGKNIFNGGGGGDDGGDGELLAAAVGLCLGCSTKYVLVVSRC